MPITISMTEAQVLTVLRSFLLSVLPEGIEVVRGQQNRVPEPEGDDFVVLWPLMRERLSTNVDAYLDNGQPYAAPNMPGTTFYTPGQRNTTQAIRMTVQVDVHGPASGDNAQIVATLFRDRYACEFFRRGISINAEDGHPIEAETGFVVLTEPIDIAPLYANDPRMIPFADGEQEIEERWTVDLVLQANPFVTVPQQSAIELVITPINVDAYSA